MYYWNDIKPANTVPFLILEESVYKSDGRYRISPTNEKRARSPMTQCNKAPHWPRAMPSPHWLISYNREFYIKIMNGTVSVIKLSGNTLGSVRSELKNGSLFLYKGGQTTKIQKTADFVTKYIQFRWSIWPKYM